MFFSSWHKSNSFVFKDWMCTCVFEVGYHRRTVWFTRINTHNSWIFHWVVVFSLKVPFWTVKAYSQKHPSMWVFRERKPKQCMHYKPNAFNVFSLQVNNLDVQPPGYFLSSGWPEAINYPWCFPAMFLYNLCLFKTFFSCLHAGLYRLLGKAC